jgi:DNA polymerase-3 subunit gamma/tau
MEDYIVSARKYRPTTFTDVIGQDAITTTLMNTVKSGKLAHAYLFCGPRGVGKTTCARIFAKAINCMNPTDDGQACNECESCKAFNEQRSYNIFELDAASNNKVDDIRVLMEQTHIPPQVGKYKVFIIDEVHMLSPSAFNAFLKTLEEPPAHVIFILATTEKQKIIPTIISRCQIFDFERMTVPRIIKHLENVADKEGIKYEEEALNIIAEKADGGMRDALSIFDQATSFCQGVITYDKVIENLNVLDVDYYFKFIDLSTDNNVGDIMLLFEKITNRGFDGGNLIIGLASHVRNILMAKDENTYKLIESSDNFRKKYIEQAKKCSTSFLYSALKILTNCDLNYKQSSNKRLLVELTLIELAQVTQKDEDPVAGRRPNKIKSLFKNLMLPDHNNVTKQVSIVRNKFKSREENKVLVSSNITRISSSNLNSENVAESSSDNSHQRLKITDIGITFANIKREEQIIVEEQNLKVENNKSEIAQHSFTQQDLEFQWNLMCNRLPHDYIGLAKRMKNMKPVVTTYPDIEVVADNQIFLNQMISIKGRIKATLSKALHNENIKLDIRISNDKEVTKILSKKEKIDFLQEQNPSFNKLISLLNLELS